MSLSSFLHLLLDPKDLVQAFGVIGVVIIIFLETGFFFGFFFPGDSLLFTAGLLASQDYMSLPMLLLGSFIAATLGNMVGYMFGRKVGPALFTRDNSLLFKKEYVSKAQHFYEKYGARTIILARFLPVIRTFAPIVAGIGGMSYKTFLYFNIIGAFLWTLLLAGLGYGFGSIIPDPDRYLLPVIIGIVVISVLPALREAFRKRVA